MVFIYFYVKYWSESTVMCARSRKKTRQKKFQCGVQLAKYLCVLIVLLCITLKKIISFQTFSIRRTLFLKRLFFL